ncbi:MAG: AAA family ATPase [Prevotella sp.]|nr:AAA family ATPase [Candidatus Prevotella equi]
MIVGREIEQHTLSRLLEKEESQFCVVYGRRRVGKTYLIRETFNYQFTFQHTGMSKTAKHGQLTAFRDSLRTCGLTGCNTPKTWIEAFSQLKLLIERAPSGKKVIFIDELPWMDTPKSGMISALENFWNGWATARAEKDIVLIVCGSATSWITKKLLKNKGGLRGRLTEKIKLSPFTLHECEKYADNVGLGMTRRDIMDTYMILGGIPYYWSFLRKGYSVAQNIDELFFAEDAKLTDEFDALYAILFNRPEKYIKVIEALSKKKYGLTRIEILKATKIQDGGTFTTVLEELDQCGFIRYYVSLNSTEQGGLYQLIDNYTLFHYHCIKKNTFADEHYWTHTCLSNDHNTWQGLAFERICLQHTRQIKNAMQITGMLSNVCSWHTAKTEEHNGAQVDLLFSRADGIINLFEIKYSKDPFSIDAKYAKELENKLSVFRTVTKTKCAVHLTMLTTYGITANKYSNMVMQSLTADCLFIK